MRTLLGTLLILGLTAIVGPQVEAQDRPASPRGEAATQIADDWIVVDYGRPILRGRSDIFGSGSEYGVAVNANAPVWRAGANKSTRLKTDVGLMFGNKMVPAGEYSLFVELKENAWTLIISTHAAKDNFRDAGDALWGAYNYTADKDVARVPMTMSKAPVSADQFTIMFADVTATGGKLVMWWEDTMAVAPFMVHKM